MLFEWLLIQQLIIRAIPKLYQNVLIPSKIVALQCLVKSILTRFSLFITKEFCRMWPSRQSFKKYNLIEFYLFVKRIDPMPVLSLTYYSSEWMTCESLGIAIMDIEWQKKNTAYRFDISSSNTYYPFSLYINIHGNWMCSFELMNKFQ